MEVRGEALLGAGRRGLPSGDGTISRYVRQVTQMFFFLYSFSCFIFYAEDSKKSVSSYFVVLVLLLYCQHFP